MHRILIKSRRRTGSYADWADVAHLEGRAVVLSNDASVHPIDLRQPQLESEEVLLARDVLDTQVVDTRGQRLSRVSDVLLQAAEDDLTVAAVDLSTSGLLRRLCPAWLARRGRILAVDWPDLHLTSRRGHLVQLSTSSSSFHRLDPAALAQLLARLSTPKATDLIRAIPPADAAAAIHRSHPRTGRRLVHALSPGERSRLITAASGEPARTVTSLGRHWPPLQRRRFRRTAGWRAHRPPGR